VRGMVDLRKLIRDVPDFPKPGILFKDITPLLGDPAGLALAVELMAQPYRDLRVATVASAESRGFIFGTALAKALSSGFAPIRKPGKLPYRARRLDYDLEYGKDAVEIHTDAIKPGQPVLVADDVLATGGTLAACCQLVRELGGQIIGVVVLIELAGLKGRDRLREYPLHSVLVY
jgi:adenine phosphoribosyltransferase